MEEKMGKTSTNATVMLQITRPSPVKIIFYHVSGAMEAR